MQTLTCSIALIHRRVETPLCCMRAWLFAVIGRRLSHSRCLLSFYLPPSLPPSFSLSLPRPPSLLCSLLQAITHTCTQVGADIYAPWCQAHRVFDASADNASVFGDHERSKIAALSINQTHPSATSPHNACVPGDLTARHGSSMHMSDIRFDIRNIHVLLSITSGHKFVMLAKREIGDTEGSECSQACVAHCGRAGKSRRIKTYVNTYQDEDYHPIAAEYHRLPPDYRGLPATTT